MYCIFLQVPDNNGDGTFRPGANTHTVAGGTVAFAAVDLNGYGRVDLAQANLNRVVVCLGNGDGTFQSGVLWLHGRLANDGKGGGVFNSPVLVATQTGSLFIAAAD